MLSTPPQRPRDDQPLFTFFVSAEKIGVITFQIPLFGACFPVFTSSIDADEYRRLQLRNLQTRYLGSSAVQFLKMLRDVETIGVRTLPFNRCPRFTADDSALATGVLLTDARHSR